MLHVLHSVEQQGFDCVVPKSGIIKHKYIRTAKFLTINKNTASLHQCSKWTTDVCWYPMAELFFGSWISYQHLSIYSISIYIFLTVLHPCFASKKYTTSTSKFPFRALVSLNFTQDFHQKPTLVFQEPSCLF